MRTPNITFVDIQLTDEQMHKIVGWINSVPDSSIIELHQTPSNISAGIAFRLHSRKDNQNHIKGSMTSGE